MMIESPVYEQILKEGRQEGREEGREEGRQEALKSGVLAVLEARFEMVPQGIENGVKAVEGLRQLEILLNSASVSKDLAKFRDFLSRVNSSVVQSVEKCDDREERGLERVQEAIMNEIEGRQRRADAYVALKILAGVKYPLEVIEKVLTRRDIMLESPLYQQLLKEGREEGREAGREEALKNGVLAVLEGRFEVLPQDIEQEVKTVQGLRQLEIVLKRASVSKDLAEFRDFLVKVRSSSPSP